MQNDRQDPAPRTPSSLSRRALLEGSATLAAASALSAPARASAAAVQKPVLVQVFLRLGMDGLTAVVPYGDAALYRLRPRLAIQPPGPPNGARNLDGFFGLAPAAAPLLTPYGNGHLAVLHAAGSLDPTRSHFAAFERMEFADPSLPYGTLGQGWASRYLEETAAAATGPLRAIAADRSLPYTLREGAQTLPIPDFADFDFPGLALTSAQREAALVDAYSRRGPAVSAPALDTMTAFGLGGVDFVHYSPQNGAQYPNTTFGARMRNIAALIKAHTGVEMISIDFGMWDLHAALGPLNGSMAALLDELTRGLEAFYKDMLGNLDDYVLVCLSEFGRHARENSSAGADHGHGNAMFVMGGHVNGGRVIANWPGLSSNELDNGDLAITIDYRDVFAEILLQRLGVTDLAPIFPQYTYTRRGVIV